MKRKVYKMRGYRAASSEYVTWTSTGTPSSSPPSGPYAGETLSNTVIDCAVTRIVPTITAITPTVALRGSGSVAIEITGTDFFPTSKIYVDGDELVTTFVSGNTLQATIPSAKTSSYGQRQVTVVTPNVRRANPIGGTSNAISFDVGVGATSITPAALTRFSGTSNTVTVGTDIILTAPISARYILPDGTVLTGTADVVGETSALCYVPEQAIDETGTVTVQVFAEGAYSQIKTFAVNNPSWLGGEYRADRGIVVVSGTTRVSAWQNVEGNTDTNRHLAQALANRQPTLVSSNVEFNGRPTIQFDRDGANTYDWMASGVWNDTGNPIHAPCNHWMVAKNTVNSAVAGTTFSALSGLNASYSHGFGVTTASGSAKIYSKAATTPWPTIEATWAAPTVVGMLFNGNTSRVYANASSSYASVALSTFGGGLLYTSYLSSNTASGVEPTNTQVGVSRLTDAVGSWNGPIAHILLSRSKVEDTENAHVMRYLGRRYGITIT